MTDHRAPTDRTSTSRLWAGVFLALFTVLAPISVTTVIVVAALRAAPGDENDQAAEPAACPISRARGPPQPPAPLRLRGADPTPEPPPARKENPTPALPETISAASPHDTPKKSQTHHRTTDAGYPHSQLRQGISLSNPRELRRHSLSTHMICRPLCQEGRANWPCRLRAPGVLVDLGVGRCLRWRACRTTHWSRLICAGWLPRTGCSAGAVRWSIDERGDGRAALSLLLFASRVAPQRCRHLDTGRLA
jgi:hypothetical protein